MMPVSVGKSLAENQGCSVVPVRTDCHACTAQASILSLLHVPGALLFMRIVLRNVDVK